MAAGSRAKAWLSAAGLIALGVLAVWGASRWLGPRPEPRPLRMLVVLDTVRSDHTSLCGYGRPTTPQLEKLAARGACTCDAIAPGAWTLPSHASFFTGRPVLEHGADFVKSGTSVEWSPSDAIRPLDERLPTLAERLAAEGYRTVGFSANAILDSVSGLTRGFEEFGACPVGDVCSSPGVNREVLRLLGEPAEDERAVFLFVNYMDAHRPWSPVPSGVAWVPPTTTVDPGGITRSFMRGRLSPAKAERFLARRTDLYDWGISRADAGLGELWAALEERGFLAHGVRLVVTSDHGELLGEHGLLDHGLSLHEENNRVPLCVVDTERPVAPFPARISALAVHELVRGEPPGAHAIESVAFPRKDFAALAGKGRELWTARWLGSRKTVLHGKVVESFDLDTVPREDAPTTPAPEDEERRRVEEMAREAEQLYSLEGVASEELLERLRALGYTR